GQTRVYDLAERVLPATVYAQPAADTPTAYRSLLCVAARALGVATADDLIDYYRLHAPTARPLLADLVREGRLAPVEVDGWSPAYRWPEARLPRRIEAAALLAPFDPLVWYRPRVERLFGFHYRLEFYVPAERREFGYYVMPFLLDDQLVARVDVKADRRAGVLRVLAAFVEDGQDPSRVVGPLWCELRALADWIGLTDVAVEDRGSLGPALAVARSRAGGGLR
ncbi:MAG TPA: crosslink repair DNA glycosylase YcaQ family protein, partial [Euzebyales bacterium]|nr:crosslink repair DNA glycosylase YcaQ family protein [Euzebyales bacterium]